MSRKNLDHRPPKELRTLKKGDVRKDGMMFWQYAKGYASGEWWVTKERFSELKELTRRIKNKYKKSEKGRASQRRYESKKRNNSTEFKITRQLRDRLYGALKAQKAQKCNATIDILGCSTSSLISHLESQFTEGMSWDNYGRDGWHIDHIKPCAAFDLTIDEEQKKCFHYSNLQPLWAEDNRKKSDTHHE